MASRRFIIILLLNPKIRIVRNFLLILIGILLFGCKSETGGNKPHLETGNPILIKDAEGFEITEYENYSIIEVKNPWPDAEKGFTYLLYNDQNEIPEDLEYDQKLKIPVNTLVVTSTTHIPALEALEMEQKLIGFPGLNYISSPKTRSLINDGKLKEIGQNENMNSEMLIDLDPDVVVGFSINASNKSFETIQKTGIPVLYNGDWTEKTPLGKAEWIKFFGVLSGKEQMADSIFRSIKKEYVSAKDLAKKDEERPKVIGGSMYQDVWYMPYGNSWQAQFLEDANSDYLYSETEGEGSMSLSLESVLNKADIAEYWISTGQFESYEELQAISPHYSEIKAVKDKNVYSVSLSKGETGGILFYELGPQRPDLILKDLIKILHPSVLKEYEPVFFKPLR